MRSKALKDYSSGDLITSSEPLVKVINNEFKGDICDNCYRCSQQKSLKMCSNCEQMYYCSEDCQKNDWFYHRFECDVFSDNQNIFQMFPKLNAHSKPIEILVLRLFLLLKNNETIASKGYQMNNGLDLCLNDIDSHSDDFKKSPGFLKSFDYMCKKFKEFGIEFSVQSLFPLFCITIRYSLTSNINFSYLTKECTLEATAIALPYTCCGLYIPLTVYRHSCSPNSALVLTGTQIQLRAIKEIKTGAQINASLYGYLYMNRTNRRKAYHLHNYFICCCIRCDTHSDKDFDFDLIASLEIKENQLGLQPDPTRYPEVIAIMEKSIDLMKTIVSECDPYLLLKYMKLIKFQLNKDPTVTDEIINSRLDYLLDLFKTIYGSDYQVLVNNEFKKLFLQVMKSSEKK